MSGKTSGDIIDTQVDIILRFYVSQYAVCVSEVRIIPIEKSDSRKGSRKATLFKSTSRNFVMEGFCIFTIFVRCLNMIPFLASSKRARVFSSCFLFPLSFLWLNRRYVTILRNFLTDFLRTSVCDDRFQLFAQSFEFHFGKFPPTRMYTRVSVRVAIEG